METNVSKSSVNILIFLVKHKQITLYKQTKFSKETLPDYCNNVNNPSLKKVGRIYAHCSSPSHVGSMS